jgi:hypothetical protein
MLEAGKLKKIFPPLPVSSFTPRQLILPLAAVFFILLAFGVVFAGVNGVFSKKPSREGAGQTLLEKTETVRPVQTGGSYRYVLSSRQVLDTYEKARRLFMDYRDEAAQVELNRIIESNASDPIKNKARLLLGYTNTPGFDTLKDRYSYAEVNVDPVLYRDCFVIWRGMAANVDNQEQSTSFDLLVGYDTRRVMEDKVPVHFSFAAAVDTEQPLEVLGRVTLASGSGDSRIIIRLEGTAIHQLPQRR